MVGDIHDQSLEFLTFPYFFLIFKIFWLFQVDNPRGWGCSVQVFKFWTYFRPDKAIFYTLFQNKLERSKLYFRPDEIQITINRLTKICVAIQPVHCLSFTLNLRCNNPQQKSLGKLTRFLRSTRIFGPYPSSAFSSKLILYPVPDQIYLNVIPLKAAKTRIVIWRLYHLPG